eukprot:7032083-Alexandrium_andersonii.AAC.1
MKTATTTCRARHVAAFANRKLTKRTICARGGIAAADGPTSSATESKDASTAPPLTARARRREGPRQGRSHWQAEDKRNQRKE